MKGPGELPPQGRTNDPESNYHIAILGAGFGGLLLGKVLLKWHPHVRFAILEQNDCINTFPTWCFFESDLPQEFAQEFVFPLTNFSWQQVQLAFPQLDKTLPLTYHCIQGHQLENKILPELKKHIFFNQKVSQVDIDSITLADGRKISTTLVVDARGWNAHRGEFSKYKCLPAHLEGLKYQKFLGLEIVLEQEHNINSPLLMDACIPQTDGFRFIYILPFTNKSMLVEDTFYSDRAQLDRSSSESFIKNYCRQKGFKIKTISRIEHGVLPIWTRNPPPTDNGHIIRLGSRGGIQHSLTGYTLPELCRQINEIFNPRNGRFSLQRPVLTHKAHWVFFTKWRRRQRFLQLLCRMLFYATAPEERWKVFRHFFKFPTSIVRAFFAGKLSFWQKLRILSQVPESVSFVKATFCLFPFLNKKAMNEDHSKGK